MIVVIPLVRVREGFTYRRFTKKADMYDAVAPVSSSAQHFTPLTLIITTGWQTFFPMCAAFIAVPSFLGWVG